MNINTNGQPSSCHDADEGSDRNTNGQAESGKNEGSQKTATRDDNDTDQQALQGESVEHDGKEEALETEGLGEENERIERIECEKEIDKEEENNNYTDDNDDGQDAVPDADVVRSFQDACSAGYLWLAMGSVNRCRNATQKRNLLNNIFTVTDRYGVKQLSALHLAIHHIQVVRWLVSGEGRKLGFDQMLAQTEDFATVLHDAACSNWQYGQAICTVLLDGCRDDEERELLLQARNKRGETALHMAAKLRDVSVFKLLLSREKPRLHFDPHNDGLGKSILHHAAHSGSLEMFLLVLETICRNKEEKKILLNSIDNLGNTVLHLAAELRENIDTVKWLFSSKEGEGVDCGFDGHKRRNNKGELPLHRAARTDMKTFQFVLNASCETDEEKRDMLNDDGCGETVLHRSSSSYNIVFSWLISSHGRKAGFDKLFTRAILSKRTALHNLAEGGMVQKYADLVNLCPNPKQRHNFITALDWKGRSVLHYATQSSDPSMIKEIVSWSELHSWVMMNQRQEDGLTALHFAVLGVTTWNFSDGHLGNFSNGHLGNSIRCRNIDIVRALLSLGEKILTVVDPNVGCGKSFTFKIE